MITIKEVTYKNYGKCLSLSNDSMELYVTINVGPRIVKCNLRGKENLMFEDIDRAMSEDVSSVYGEGKNWYIYGGHRLWLSPESLPETYYPDNDRVVYSTCSTGAEFIPPVQAVRELQFSVSVELHETEPRAVIHHKITNMGEKPVTGAAWSLSVMDKGGMIVIPQPQEDTGLLANRVLALWPYTDMTDSRIFFGNKYIALHQNPDIDKKIKIGINNTAGKIAYINHGQAMVKSFEPDFENGTYPDFGVSCEAFANRYFTESETLSPLKTVAHGESIEHTEVWTLFDGIEIPESKNDALEALGNIVF